MRAKDVSWETRALSLAFCYRHSAMVGGLGLMVHFCLQGPLGNVDLAETLSYSLCSTLRHVHIHTRKQAYTHAHNGTAHTCITSLYQTKVSLLLSILLQQILFCTHQHSPQYKSTPNTVICHHTAPPTQGFYTPTQNLF